MKKMSIVVERISKKGSCVICEFRVNPEELEINLKNIKEQVQELTEVFGYNYVIYVKGE